MSRGFVAFLKNKRKKDLWQSKEDDLEQSTSDKSSILPMQLQIIIETATNYSQYFMKL
jgi:hypothetical protein